MGLEPGVRSPLGRIHGSLAGPTVVTPRYCLPVCLQVIHVADDPQSASFPFSVSTELYPAWTLAALPTVPAVVSKAVAHSLMLINRTDRVAVAGSYASWDTPVSYAMPRKVSVPPPATGWGLGLWARVWFCRITSHPPGRRPGHAPGLPAHCSPGGGAPPNESESRVGGVCAKRLEGPSFPSVPERCVPTRFG